MYYLFPKGATHRVIPIVLSVFISKVLSIHMLLQLRTLTLISKGRSIGSITFAYFNHEDLPFLMIVLKGICHVREEIFKFVSTFGAILGVLSTKRKN